MKLLLIPIRLIGAFFLAAVFVFGSELRCHCNLPSCAKSNSMCKTVLGCFQELPSINQRELRHGCLELWPSKRPYQCAADVVGGEDEIVVQKIYSSPSDSSHKKNDPLSAHHGNQRRHNTIALRCCLQDMCNFVDVDRTVENRLHTLELNILPLYANSGDRNNALTVAKTPTSATTDIRNAWFTAALIIVPVLGALVLVLLILFACFLLKYDTKNERQNNYYDAIGNDFDVDDDDDLVVKLNKINVVSVDNFIRSSSTPLSNQPAVITKTCQSLPFIDSKRIKSEHLFIDIDHKSSPSSLRTAKSDSVLL